MFWDEPKVGVGEYRARRGEVRMIENVEEIAFEPEAQPLPDREVAVDGEIELLKVEAAQRITAQIPLGMKVSSRSNHIGLPAKAALHRVLHTPRRQSLRQSGAEWCIDGGIVECAPSRAGSFVFDRAARLEIEIRELRGLRGHWARYCEECPHASNFGHVYDCEPRRLRESAFCCWESHATLPKPHGTLQTLWHLAENTTAAQNEITVKDDEKALAEALGLYDIGYQGYAGFELFHPLPIVNGPSVGIDFIDADRRATYGLDAPRSQRIPFSISLFCVGDVKILSPCPMFM